MTPGIRALCPVSSLGATTHPCKSTTCARLRPYPPTCALFPPILLSCSSGLLPPPACSRLQPVRPPAPSTPPASPSTAPLLAPCSSLPLRCSTALLRSAAPPLRRSAPPLRSTAPLRRPAPPFSKEISVRLTLAAPARVRWPHGTKRTQLRRCSCGLLRSFMIKWSGPKCVSWPSDYTCGIFYS